MKISLLNIKSFNFFILFSLLILVSSHYSEEEITSTVDQKIITYGSVLRLMHTMTHFHIHSHKLQWGTGSQQQSVTAVTDIDDTNSLWIIKESHGQIPITSGSPVKCGDIIRLEHVNTQRNLHTHDFRSWITDSQEVSCLGEAGNGDFLDNWEIQCHNNEKFLHGNTKFYLYHNVTKHYLYINIRKSLYNDMNCMNCPIRGQREVSATRHKDAQGLWKVVGYFKECRRRKSRKTRPIIERVKYIGKV